MNTITYSRENYTGETSDVVIYNNGTFKDSVYGKGTWEHEQAESDYQVMRIKIDGVPFRAVKFDNANWYAEDLDMARDDSNGIVACLKLASNTM